jgi:hypothetical protein
MYLQPADPAQSWIELDMAVHVAEMARTTRITLSLYILSASFELSLNGKGSSKEAEFLACGAAAYLKEKTTGSDRTAYWLGTLQPPASIQSTLRYPPRKSD